MLHISFCLHCCIKFKAQFLYFHFFVMKIIKKKKKTTSNVNI